MPTTEISLLGGQNIVIDPVRAGRNIFTNQFSRPITAMNYHFLKKPGPFTTITSNTKLRSLLIKNTSQTTTWIFWSNTQMGEPNFTRRKAMNRIYGK